MFYVRVSDVLRFACRAVKQAHAKGLQVVVWLSDEVALQRFDQRLWTFEPTAFVPHRVWRGQGAFPDTKDEVILAAGSVLVRVPANCTVLNLSQNLWSEASVKPSRVLEIVGVSEEELAAARVRFKAYAAAGFQVEHDNRDGKD